ncbi:C45 family autoproteolytic acyltransferase/hydrolase [Streptomyces shenzhenensis]|uniref:C45 family autoproteolytic acyltransferase/hydolase n=1 Tax=Streptomyces shenzhenensis TaxID=943815 RepID=UPI0038229FB4
MGRDPVQRPVIARHHTDTADPAARGHALGTADGPRIRAGIAAYQELFEAVHVDPDLLRPYGEQAAEEIRRWAPALHEELAALAGAAGVDLWHLGMLNARTEILATVGATAEGECSTAVHVGGAGAPHTIQTWDWHEEFTDTKTLARHPAARVGEVRTFTEAGILGKIGLNSAGLGLHFNILSHTADGARIGVPVHVVARRILDEATTLAEAVDIARSAEVSASTVLTVVTFDGRDSDGVCIELSPAGTAVLPPDADGYLLHTNHFLDPRLAEGELAAPTGSTYARLKHLAARRELLASPDPAHWTELLHAHESDGAPVCCHPQPGLPFHQQWRTLLTASLDLASGRLRCHDGGPCTAGEDTSWEYF